MSTVRKHLIGKVLQWDDSRKWFLTAFRTSTTVHAAAPKRHAVIIGINNSADTRKHLARIPSQNPALRTPNGPAAVGTDSNVACARSYGLSGSAASHSRLEKVTLPGGREVYCDYETGGQFRT